MPQTFPYPPGDQINSAPQPEPVDQRVIHDMKALAGEANERAAFHSVELERWQRAGRAAIAALDVLASDQDGSEQLAQPESLRKY